MCRKTMIFLMEGKLCDDSGLYNLSKIKFQARTI